VIVRPPLGAGAGIRKGRVRFSGRKTLWIGKMNAANSARARITFLERGADIARHLLLHESNCFLQVVTETDPEIKQGKWGEIRKTIALRVKNEDSTNAEQS